MKKFFRVLFNCYSYSPKFKKVCSAVVLFNLQIQFKIWIPGETSVVFLVTLTNLATPKKTKLE